MFVKILIGSSTALALLAGVVAAQPSTFHVERSTVVAAPPEAAFARVNDLRAFITWSPFEDKDPAMKRLYSGPESGVGASYAWESDQIGIGRMTIDRSEPGRVVGIKLDFVKPFPAHDRATYTFSAVPGGTKVTWAMDGESGFVGKGMGLIFDLDSHLGKEFERGLASLKRVTEKAAGTSGTRS